MEKASSALYQFPHMVHGGDYNPDQWLDSPELLQEDLRLMKLAGINGVSVGIFAWASLEPEEGVYQFSWLDKILDELAANGVSVILATPSGARPAWMDRNHPEVLRVTPDRRRRLHGGRHNHCYTSPYYRRKVKEMNTLLAQRYGLHPAVRMWHISNEYGGECHCPLCQEAFREWLRNKYCNDIGELNRQWWTSFWSHTYGGFEEIESPSSLGEQSIHGLVLDWKRFVTAQTLSFLQNESEPLKKYAPHLPVTTNFMTMYEGLDYSKIVPSVDVISWDNYPAWGKHGTDHTTEAVFAAFCHDYFRSMKKAPFLLMESTPSQVNWQPVNKLKRPGVHLLSSLQAVAHGADSVMYFQWRKSRGSAEKFHGAVVDHYGKEDTRVFREVAQLGDILSRLDGVVGTVPQSRVALLYDCENSWAIREFQGFVRPEARDYVGTLLQFYRPFWKRGIDCDVIGQEGDFSPYSLLVAPMLYALKPGVADRLKDYAVRGGTVLLTYLSGYVNENDLCFLGGFPGDGLGQLAGLRTEETDGLFPEDSNEAVFSKNDLGISGKFPLHTLCEIMVPEKDCQVLASYGQDFYAGTPVVTYHPYGMGGCYYIAARGRGDLEDALCGALAEKLALLPTLYGALPEGVTVRCREGGGERYLFFLNFTAEEKEFRLNGGLADVLTGESLPETLTLPGYGWRIVRH